MKSAKNDLIIIEEDDEVEQEKNKPLSLSTLMKLYQNLWGEDYLDFAITGSEFVGNCKKLFEIDENYEKIKRTRLCFHETFITLIERFKLALPDERDEILEQIYSRKSQHFPISDHFRIFIQAIESKNVVLMNSIFDRLLDHIDSNEQLEKQLWILLCFNTYNISIFQSPKMISYRILPNFVYGTLKNREFLSEYLQYVCNYIAHHHEEDFTLSSKFRPIFEIESGVWFCRIILEFIQLQQQQQQQQQIAKLMLQLSGICSNEMIIRESKRYGIESACQLT